MKPNTVYLGQLLYTTSLYTKMKPKYPVFRRQTYCAGDIIQNQSVISYRGLKTRYEGPSQLNPERNSFLHNLHFILKTDIMVMKQLNSFQTCIRKHLGFMISTATSHQGAIKIPWLHFWGADVVSMTIIYL